MTDNFINPETNETFYISSYKTKVVGNEVKYFKTVKFKEQLNDNGVILEKIGEIKTLGVRTPTKNRI